jgi:hypothetical protein
MSNIAIDQYAVPEGLTLLEKRSPKRFDLELRGTAVFKEEGQAVERRIVSRNVSGYGAYLVTDACPQIGDVVDIHLDGPLGHKQEEISLGAVGKILRVNRLSGNTCGVAVKFEAITASLKGGN